MTTQGMAETVERLFKRLAATYGSAWFREIGETPMADSQAVWAHTLRDFAYLPHRIDWALQNLPERCPNPIAFKNLCQQAPSPELARLESPPITPERLQQALKNLPHFDRTARANPKEWIKRLKARQAAGEVLGMYQIGCLRSAQGLDGICT